MCYLRFSDSRKEFQVLIAALLFKCDFNVFDSIEILFYEFIVLKLINCCSLYVDKASQAY